jgi:hypothetical protein
MSKPHVVYYSTRCRHSQNFLEELSRTPYSKEFTFVCVDKAPDGSRPPLPADIKKVPTLRIQGESEVRTDSQVLNWLSERRLRERQDAAPGGGFLGSIGGSSSAGPSAGPDGPMAYDGDGFTMGDEGFAFLTDNTNPSSSGGMVRLTHGMTSIGSGPPAGADPSRTSNMMGSGGSSAGPRVSAKSKALDDAFEKFRAGRDGEFKGVQRL